MDKINRRRKIKIQIETKSQCISQCADSILGVALRACVCNESAQISSYTIVDCANHYDGVVMKFAALRFTTARANTAAGAFTFSVGDDDNASPPPSPAAAAAAPPPPPPPPTATAAEPLPALVAGGAANAAAVVVYRCAS